MSLKMVVQLSPRKKGEEDMWKGILEKIKEELWDEAPYEVYDFPGEIEEIYFLPQTIIAAKRIIDIIGEMTIKIVFQVAPLKPEEEVMLEKTEEDMWWRIIERVEKKLGEQTSYEMSYFPLNILEEIRFFPQNPGAAKKIIDIFDKVSFWWAL